MVPVPQPHSGPASRAGNNGTTWFARHERTCVIVLVIALSILSFIPHIAAFTHTPAGFRYVWSNYPGSPHDINSYFTWIRQASDGDWLFNLKYTSEPTPRVVFHPLFLAMGLLIRIGIPLTAVWVVAQIASIAALVYSLRRFLAHLFDNPVRRLFVMAVALVSGGLGFLTNTFRLYRSFDTLPVDMGMAEVTLARSIMTPFVFAFSIALMLCVFALLISFERSRRRSDIVLASLAAFALGIIHPYDIVIVAVVATVFLLMRLGLHAAKPLAILGAAAAIPYLYYMLVMTNTLYAQAGNAEMRSPAPLAYLLGFGLLLPFAVAGAVMLFRARAFRGNPAWLLALIFLLVVPILVYAPFTFQRKLIEGWIVPLTAFAAVGMLWIWAKVKTFGPLRHALIRTVVVTSAIAILSLSPLTLLRNDLVRVREAGFPYYMSESELAGMRWLAQHTDRSAVVLSAPDYGNIVPRFSGNTVFIGHWAQTVDFDRKAQEAHAFYTGTIQATDRAAFLTRERIAYVIVGPLERRYGAPYVLVGDPLLAPAFANDDITIYRVIGAT